MTERLSVANAAPFADARRALNATVVVGELLDPVWLLNRVVFPIVQWNPEALEARMATGIGPVLDRTSVRDRVDEIGRPVLDVLGFVICGSLERSRSALATLSYYGATVLSTRLATDWESWECQVGGHWLVKITDRETTVLNRGRAGRRPESRPTPIQASLMVEQLFDAAIRCGSERSIGRRSPKH